MAIYFNGLTTGELRAWTGRWSPRASASISAACASPRGQALDRRRRGQGLAGARSAVASCGAAVPQLSGRASGIPRHAGKLESIPGWRAGLSGEGLIAALTRPAR